MQTRTLRYPAVFALFATLAALGGVVQTQQKTTQPPHYYVINLGDPLGVPSAAAASINNIGWIAGDAFATRECRCNSTVTVRAIAGRG